MEIYNTPSYFNFPELPVEFTGRKAMWGLSPIAPLHLGYDPLFGMLSQLARLGAKPQTLLADVHAMLSHELMREAASVRADYYRDVILRVFEIETDVILGSELHFSERYTAHLYGLLQRCTIADAKNAAGAAAKGKRDTIDRYVYPMMQCVDAIVMEPDIIVAERSQEKIYRLLYALLDDARFDAIHPWLSKVTFIYVDSAHDLSGARIQLSSKATRISYHDADALLEEKVRKMFAPASCREMHGKQNSLLEIFRYSVYPMADRVDDMNLPFPSFEAMEAAYLDNRYHPGDAKIDLLKALKTRRDWFNSRLPAASATWILPAFYTVE